MVINIRPKKTRYIVWEKKTAGGGMQFEFELSDDGKIGLFNDDGGREFVFNGKLNKKTITRWRTLLKLMDAAIGYAEKQDDFMEGGANK